MLKQSVTFEDYNGETQTETLYFNLTKTEMMDMFDLLPRLEKWQNFKAGEMKTEDTLEFFAIIKELVAASYGVRSEDGKFFRKSPEAFSDFESSAMYDAFIFGFITNPEKALEFMIEILPKGIDDKAIASARGTLADFQAKQTESPAKTMVETPLSDELSIDNAVDLDTRPAYIKEDREPTPEELQAMSKEEMQEAFKRRFSKP